MCKKLCLICPECSHFYFVLRYLLCVTISTVSHRWWNAVWDALFYSSTLSLYLSLILYLPTPFFYSTPSLYPSLILYLPIPSSTLLYLSISPFLSSTLLYLSIHLVSSISPFLSSTLLYSISLSISYPLSPHSFLLLYSISLLHLFSSIYSTFAKFIIKPL